MNINDHPDPLLSRRALAAGVDIRLPLFLYCRPAGVSPFVENWWIIRQVGAAIGPAGPAACLHAMQSCAAAQ
ncbi:MAG: hypothetical protein ACKO3T_25310 [Planctomycetaceae bacterium]